MTAPVSVRGLGKRYRLGAREERARSLRVALTRAVTAPLRNLRELQKLRNADEETDRTVWALDEVTFDVNAGEVLGVIGRNGAGKSTLLKVLGRITAPTRGEAELRGTLGSLLEVGTGFHPELSGRDNVFLSGSILGMDEAYIRNSFDEIVSFAGVEKFIDTPVKRYSSGMYVRLAFAVAAHLPSDILLVDEVLAVGDAEFQKKCLGKMSAVAESGRTILFVSHNLASVQRLCDRLLVLEHGRVKSLGDVDDGIHQYLSAIDGAAESLADRTDRSGSGALWVTGLDFRSIEGEPLPAATSGADLEVWIRTTRRTDRPLHGLTVSLELRTFLDAPIAALSTRLTGETFTAVPDGAAFVCRIPRLPLPSGTYRIGVRLSEGYDTLDRIDDAAKLDVVGGDFYGTGQTPKDRRLMVLMDGSWRMAETHEH
ncbi:MAG: ABC transporter ATP-binding protein [Myxococcota bacterium]